MNNSYSNNLNEYIKSVTVKIRSEKVTGTGVIVKSTQQGKYILTAAHICTTGQKENVHTPLSNLYEYDIFYIDGDRGYVQEVNTQKDLCLIYLESKSKIKQFYLKLSSKAYHGDRTITYGFPGNSYGGVFFEGFLGEDILGRSNLFQEASLPAYYGQSGSGVFNLKGELVGIVSFTRLPTFLISGIANIRSIKDFLKGAF
jgi:S1-C subfamily serine protease